MDEYLPENKWYKEEEKDIAVNQKPFKMGHEILLSDEEVHLWSKPWKNTLIGSRKKSEF